MWLSLIWAKLNLPLRGLERAGPAESVGPQDAAADGVKDPGANPGHAFEEATPVDAVVMVIVNDFVFHMVMFFSSGLCSVLITSNDADRNWRVNIPRKAVNSIVGIKSSKHQSGW